MMIRFMRAIKNMATTTCLLLQRPSDHSVLLLNNLNASDSLFSKQVIPYSFWGLPFIHHEKNNPPLLSDILKHNNILLEPSKDRKLSTLDTVSTPNFIDSVFDISFVSYSLEESDKLDYNQPREHTKYEMTSIPHILKQFETGQLNISPEVSNILKKVAYPENSTPTLDLEFSPRFHCFPILSNTIPPFKTTNLVVVVSKQSALIVDPGASAHGKDAFVSVLRRLREMGVRELQVFITHHHKDHWEGLTYLSEPKVFEANEISVIAHKLSLEKLEVPFTKKGVADGDILNVAELSIKVVGTPGHTDNSLSLFHENTRTLVAGDHIVGMGSAVLDFSCGNMKQYFESTKKMIELNPRVAYPAHGPPNFAPVQLLETYLKHRQAREDAILAAYNNGHHSTDDIVKVVYSDVPEAMWGFAKSNISLHLGKLSEDGKIRIKNSL